FGMAVVTRTDDVGRSPGAFGSDVAPPRRRIVIRQNTSSGSCVAACDVVKLKSAQCLNMSLVGLVTGGIWGTCVGRLQSSGPVGSRCASRLAFVGHEVLQPHGSQTREGESQ